MRILIIEDEVRNANRLKKLFEETGSFDVIDTYPESVDDSVAWLKNNEQPDLIMMDIRLADGLSFEIFDQVAISCPVIFTTAYDEYALRAFKVNSIAYLLKPVELDDLQQAMDKLQVLSGFKVVNSDYGQLSSKFLTHEPIYRTRYLLPYKDEYRTVKVEDILFIYTELKITYLALKDGSCIPIAQTLEEIEEQLDPRNYFRLNRQFIVHIDAIKSIHNYFNGKLKVQLYKQTSAEIVVSRERAPFFKTWLNR